MSPIEFFRILTPILPMIGNNHTNITPPKGYIEFISKKTKRFPFSLYHYDGSFYILEDASKEYIMKESGLSEENCSKAIRLVLSGSQDGPDIALIYKYLKNYIGEIVK